MTARTPAGTPPPAARITILDILRALALLGIVIVHTHDHFNLYLPMPPAEGWQAAANSAADWAYEHLFVSKSFLLFSFLLDSASSSSWTGGSSRESTSGSASCGA